VRVDLLGEVTWEEPETLTRLDRGPREDETRDLSITQRHDTHCGAQKSLPGASWSCAEHEIVLAYRIDVLTLVGRLRRDAFSAHRRRHEIAHLLGRADRRVLRVTDEPLERGLPQRLVML